MKRFLTGKTFASAEDLFEYLKTLKDIRLKGQNGVFQCHAEDVDKQFAFIKCYYSRDIYEHRIKRRQRPQFDTFYNFYFRRGRITMILLTSNQLTTDYTRVKGKWRECDRMLYNPKKRWLAVSEEQKRACVAGLVEALTVKANKVS